MLIKLYVYAFSAPFNNYSVFVDIKHFMEFRLSFSFCSSHTKNNYFR